MNLGISDDGCVVEFSMSSSGISAYFEWDGSSWQETTPTFSVFRLANIGLDFGISSNNLKVTDASLLLEELEKNPEKFSSLCRSAGRRCYDSTVKLLAVSRESPSL